MMGYGASSSESTEGEEAVEAPGPPPEPRVPEPRAPEPEPGLDLSLSPSPLPESPQRRDGGPGRRKGRRGGSRRGRQVRFLLAPRASGGPEPAAAAPGDGPAAPHELEAPGLQSSLALSLELRSARAAAAHFDAARAVEQRLRTSFRARCALEETVAEGGARAGARYDRAVRPGLSVLRISALGGGRAARAEASSPAPPFRRHLPHASDAEALGGVALKTTRTAFP
ncbi:protein phosphatase 1 regulatory subunit 35 isoform X2 [Meriones unguiculatus]|uniref:protein phosphatase 1 regulatory subunit 35 isoform X2 n=1 Tax=Meriones unguiculatus TaxID=10047 RepID=UPI00293EDDB7|nr:protein phosphatase 1 regulatory subunit 35 isoform X2 [Meriones unguiculatus]